MGDRYWNKVHLEDKMHAGDCVWLLGEYKSVLADSHNLLSGVNVSTD